MNRKINDFLSRLKGEYPAEICFVFYHGFCYWLAFILADRFNGEIWFNPGTVHFACMIEGVLYDVFGEVEQKEEWTSWEKFQMEHHEEAQGVIDSCIKKV